MPKVYRTAQGKMLDMAALIAKNEKTRAVGNMNVNARGDTVDGHNRVVVPANEKVSNHYAKTVGNKSANPVKQAAKVVPVNPKQPKLSQEELALDEEFNDGAEEIIAIKNQEKGK